MKKSNRISWFVLLIIFLANSSEISSAEMQALSQSSSAPQQVSNLNYLTGSQLKITTGAMTTPAERCDSQGNQQNGSTTCVQNETNGRVLHTLKQYEIHGSSKKFQTVATLYDREGRRLDRKSIRQRIDYKIDESGMAKKAEFFDVVERPTHGKITRTILIYQYDPKTQNLKKMTWTKYLQIGNTKFASLLKHVTLTYDDRGAPLKGRAEKWLDGVRTEKVFSWDREVKGSLGLEQSGWREWEGSVHQFYNQANLA